MKLVYLIQLVFLLLAFWYGYRYEASSQRIVLFTFLNELLYGLVVIVLYDYVDTLVQWGLDAGCADRIRLSIFDLYRLEKEQWLSNFIRWIARQNGRNISWRFDQMYLLLALTGGFFITLTTVLGGTILRNAAHQSRRRRAGYERTA